MNELDDIHINQACASNAHKVAMAWDTKSIGPKVDMTDNNYKFQKGERKNMEKACEIRHPHVVPQVGTPEGRQRIRECMEGTTEDSFNRMLVEATKLIDRQAERIKAKDAVLTYLRDNVSRDNMLSIQSIETLCKQGLRGNKNAVKNMEKSLKGGA